MIEASERQGSQMPSSVSGDGHSVGLIVGVVIALVVLLMRNRQPRKLRVELLWIRPLIFLGLLATIAVASPPPLTPMSIGIMIGALAFGCALGWQRGRFIRIEVVSESHALTSRASPIGLVFILALLAARLGLGNLLSRNAAVLHVPALAIADALIAFAAGMMATQSLEMWLRARRLLAQARAAKDGDSMPTINPPIIR